MISLGAGIHGGMIITPDFRKSGTDAVQLTYFTKDGQPSGHTTFKKLADALDENFLDVDHPVSRLKKNTDPVKVFSAYEEALFEPHNDEILHAPFHYLSPLRPLTGVAVEGFVSSDLSGRMGVLSRYEPLDLDTQVRLNLFPMSPEAIRAAAEELAVMLAPKLKSRYARKLAENPLIRHTSARNPLTTQESANASHDLQTIRDSIDRWFPVAKERGLPMPLSGTLDDFVLGCGMYGCVFQTEDPKIVIKFTRDDSEAEMLNFQQNMSLPGIVPVHFVLKMTKIQSWRAEYLIWRDRLDMCCSEAVKSLMVEHDLLNWVLTDSDWGWEPSDQYGIALRTYKSLLEARNVSKEEIQDFCDEMSGIPGLRDIANGLHELANFDVYLDDIHMKNVGRFNDYDQLIIFDATATGDTDKLSEYPIEEI